MTDVIAGSVGGFNIYWYGITVSLALSMGLLITKLLVNVKRESFSVIIDIFLYGIPVALVTSRLLYAVRHWYLFSGNITELFMLTHGGLSIYGGFLGFFCVLVLYTYKNNLSLYHWLDILAPAIVGGLLINQFSHFIFQANIGAPVDEAIAVHSHIIQYVEYAFRPSGFEGYEYFKPVALYHSVWLLLVFMAVTALAFYNQYQHCLQEGTLILLSLLLMLSGRFYFGFLYLTTNPSGDLHFGQIVSLVGAILCAGLLVKRYLSKRRNRRGMGIYIAGRNN